MLLLSIGNADERQHLYAQGNVQTYMKMLHLMEKEDLIPTLDEVECPVCFCKGPGITLRDCLHSFCR